MLWRKTTITRHMLHNQAGQRPAHTLPARPSGRRRRILFVDDDPLMRAMVEAVLQSTGAYDLCIGDNGTEALDNLHWFNPDLILLDVMMPGLGGTHTLQILRIDPAFRDVPIVFITGKTAQTDMDTYERLGAAAVIAKPFTKDNLIRVVEKVCASSRRDAVNVH